MSTHLDYKSLHIPQMTDQNKSPPPKKKKNTLLLLRESQNGYIHENIVGNLFIHYITTSILSFCEKGKL